MKLIYFAWVRERIGRAEEVVDLPADVTTVAALIDWLKAQDETYVHAFEHAAHIRVAIDRRHVRHDATLAGAGEVAFFPPMTGG